MDAMIPWIGGKRLLRKTISEMIPGDITTYIEPFGGAGWVMFYKDRWAKHEVYNDLNGDLTNLFKYVKYHPDSLVAELDFFVHSRELFKDIKVNPGITELQRAARFMWLTCFSFGAKGESVATSKLGESRSLQNRFKKIRDLHDRLDRVMIENLDYRELFNRYDQPGAFFYTDPPYFHGVKYDNAKNFDHEELRDMLFKLKGRWLLSYDDCPEIRELYAGCKIVGVTRQKGINRKLGDMEYKEVIIMPG